MFAIQVHARKEINSMIICDCVSYYLNDECKLDGINIAISQYDSFGVMGPNGSGKTCLLEIIAGYLTISNGNAYVANRCLTSGFDVKQYAEIGFLCDQDACLPFLTPKEMLTIFARLRQINTHRIEESVNNMLSILMLTHVQDKRCNTLGYGHKRLTNIGMCLLGKPKLIFLDHPTQGLDSFCKKRVWELIVSCQRNGSTMLISSHNPSEVEILCSKMTVMVDGAFRVLGTPNEIKSKVICYTIQIHVPREMSARLLASVVDMHRYMVRYWNSVEVMDKHSKHIAFILYEKTNLSLIYRVVLKLKKDHNFKYFSIHETSLHDSYERITNTDHTFKRRVEEKTLYRPALNTMLNLYNLAYTMTNGVVMPNRFYNRSELSLNKVDPLMPTGSKETIGITKPGRMPYLHGLLDNLMLTNDQNELLTPLKPEKPKRKSSCTEYDLTSCYSNLDSSSLSMQVKPENPLFTTVLPEQDSALEKKGKLLDELMRLECGAFRRKARDSRLKYDTELKKKSMY